MKERLKERYIGDWNKIAGKTKMVQGQNNKGKYAVRDWSDNDELGLGVIVSGKLNGETEPRELTVMMNQCAVRNSTLWVTFPQQQIYYFAVKMWFRRYCPDAIMGMYSPDELETIDVTPTITVIEEPEPTAIATKETLDKVHELFAKVPPHVQLKAKQRIEQEGDSITQEFAEKMIAYLHGQIPESAQEKASVHQENPELLSITDETKDNISHFMDTDGLSREIIEKANALLDSPDATEDQGKAMLTEMLDEIDSTETE
jgi:hypothetical protein